MRSCLDRNCSSGFELRVSLFHSPDVGRCKLIIPDNRSYILGYIYGGLLRFKKGTTTCFNASRTGCRDALQLLFPRAQPRDLVADIVKLRDRDRIGLVAGMPGLSNSLRSARMPSTGKPRSRACLIKARRSTLTRP